MLRHANTMTGNRWWHVFFGVTMLTVTILTILTYSPSTAHRVVSLVSIAVVTIAYVTVGRTALATGEYARLFVVVLVIGAGAMVSGSPNTAVVQAICFPLIWMAFENTRRAIMANVVLALAIGIGFLVSLGISPETLIQTCVIEAISLIGSLALGLWITRISELSTQRQRLLDELTATQEALATANRDSGVTSERERLAREIHDTIAQSLTGLVMLSQRAQRELFAGNTSTLADQLALMEESARDALVETRSLVAASAPVELGGGIVAALERLGERFERETSIRILVSAPACPELDRDTKVVLLRSAQETLANVRKHSGAREVNIMLRATNDAVTLLVRDDGVGFCVSPRQDGFGSGGFGSGGFGSRGFGLSGMRERLALVNGALSIESQPGGGTTVLVTLPMVAA